MPKFIVTLPDGSEATHELIEAQITVGRLPDNTMQIEDASVSSHHAELTRGDNGDYTLVDIGSTNGTMLNGREISEGEQHRLQAGDRVVFGKIEAAYDSENPAEARPMPKEEQAPAVVGASSVRPADFSNESPFKTKHKKKDPVGMAILGFAGLSFLAFCAAVVAILSMKAPL
jgi:pSer/pThr/pTyr-binding forkhead associated (FHA) protein